MPKFRVRKFKNHNNQVAQSRDQVAQSRVAQSRVA